MAVVTTGKTWANGDGVTAANLNLQWTGATFASGAVDSSTTALSGGAIIVKDLGVSTAKIAASAVTTAKIADNAVTVAKLASTLDLSSNTVTLPDDVVATAKIVDDAVTYAKVDVATQAELEAESSAGVVTPDVTKYIPGVAKAFCTVTYDGSAPTASASFNVASVTEPSEDVRRITFTSAMDSANYVVMITGNFQSNAAPYISAKNAAYVEITNLAQGDAASRSLDVVVFGTLA